MPGEKSSSEAQTGTGFRPAGVEPPGRGADVSTAAGTPPAVGSAASGGRSAAPVSAQPPGSAVPSPSAPTGATLPGTGNARTATAMAPSAGRIEPGVDYRGVATAYAAGDGSGSCLYGPSDDLMIAAMSFTDYETARACGAYVRIRASNGVTLTVRIVNVCPLPCAVGQLDLSREAFARLADLSVGRLPITWTLLSPDGVGTVSFRYKTGSSKWWCGIQVIGHRNPLATLEVRAGNGWRRLPRTDYNYFLSTDGTGCGGPIRITDVYGERLTVDRIVVKSDVAQPTGVQSARHRS